MAAKEISKVLENYTPHAIHVCGGTFVSNGNIRMKNAAALLVGKWNGDVPVYEAPTYEGFDTLPEAITKDTTERGILVSMPIGEYVRKNPTSLPPYLMILGPDTSPANVVRNEKGEISGTKALILYRDYLE